MITAVFKEQAVVLSESIDLLVCCDDQFVGNN